MRRHRGVALVVVLWVVALLSLMVTSFGLGVRREARLVTNLAAMARLRAAAEAAVHYAAYRVTHPDPQVRWRADGSVYGMTLDDAEVRVRVVDEGGKVDLNQADEPLLRAVLEHVGAEPERAAALVDAILDWRDGDRNRRVNGAEANDYRAAGLGYEPADNLFGSVTEVGLVLGMTPELTRALLPLVTIYSGQRGINPQVAPAEVLKALPGIDPGLVDTYVQTRGQAQPGKPAPVPLPPVPGVSYHTIAGRALGVDVEVRGQSASLSLRVALRLGQEIEYLDWGETPMPKPLFDDAGVIQADPVGPQQPAPD